MRADHRVVRCQGSAPEVHRGREADRTAGERAASSCEGRRLAGGGAGARASRLGAPRCRSAPAGEAPPPWPRPQGARCGCAGLEARMREQTWARCLGGAVAGCGCRSGTLAACQPAPHPSLCLLPPPSPDDLFTWCLRRSQLHSDSSRSPQGFIVPGLPSFLCNPDCVWGHLLPLPGVRSDSSGQEL